MSRFLKILKTVLNYFNRVFNKVSWSSIVVETKVDKNASIRSKVNIRYSSIGSYSYIGKKSNISHAEIGKFCSIANEVSIGGGSHPLNWVSTSPVFHSGRNTFNYNFSKLDFLAYKKTII